MNGSNVTSQMKTNTFFIYKTKINCDVCKPGYCSSQNTKYPSLTIS